MNTDQACLWPNVHCFQQVASSLSVRAWLIPAGRSGRFKSFLVPSTIGRNNFRLESGKRATKSMKAQFVTRSVRSKSWWLWIFLCQLVAVASMIPSGASTIISSSIAFPELIDSSWLRRLALFRGWQVSTFDLSGLARHPLKRWHWQIGAVDISRKTGN